MLLEVRKQCLGLPQCKLLQHHMNRCLYSSACVQGVKGHENQMQPVGDLYFVSVGGGGDYI